MSCYQATSHRNCYDKFTATAHLNIKSYSLSTTDPVQCSRLIIRDSERRSDIVDKAILIKHLKGRWYWHITLTVHLPSHWLNVSITRIRTLSSTALNSLALTPQSWRSRGHLTSKQVYTVLLWQSLVFVDLALTLKGRVQSKCSWIRYHRWLCGSQTAAGRYDGPREFTDHSHQRSAFSLRPQRF